MIPPASFETLKKNIEGSYSDLSEHLRRIGRFALEHPNDIALGTVVQVAKSANVQPSAVIRFANAFGYKGFSEMQLIFRGNLLDRSDSYRDRINQMRTHQAAGGGAGDILHQLVTAAIGDLGSLDEQILQKDVAKAVRLLATGPRIFLLAQRRSFPIVGYLAYALGRLELKTHLLDGVGGMLQESLRAISQKDVLMVASFRDYTPAVVEAAVAAADIGCSIIAITDGPLSPLKAPSNVCFELMTDSNQAFRSLVGPMCLAQALVVGTGYYLDERKQAASSKDSKKRNVEA